MTWFQQEIQTRILYSLLLVHITFLKTDRKCIQNHSCIIAFRVIFSSRKSWSCFMFSIFNLWLSTGTNTSYAPNFNIYLIYRLVKGFNEYFVSCFIFTFDINNETKIKKNASSYTIELNCQ